jgi:hypothetical protein
MEQSEPHLCRHIAEDQDPDGQPLADRDVLPLGAIHLDVNFGTPSNFRKEKIEFEVVDWPLQYHAILG